MAEYIDVVIDTDPQDIMDEFTTFMQTFIPGWQPAPGNLDVWLMQVIAFVAAENRDVASRVPKSIFRWFGATLVNLPPNDAVQASVLSTWTVQDNAGYTIPAGTQVSIARTGDEVYAFATVTDVIIPPGSTVANNVQLLAVLAGADASNLGVPGGAVALLDPLTFVTAITQVAATSGGVDAESDDDYLNRLAAELRLLAPRPILPPDFAIFARQIAGVARSTAIDGYNPFHNLLNLNDASFETSVAGWAVAANCAIVQTVAQAADGTHSMQMTASSAADMSARLAAADEIAVTPGDTITAVAFFRTAVTGRNCKVGVQWYDVADASISTVYGPTVLDTNAGWTEASVTAMAPANATHVRIVAFVTAPANAEVHYVDEASIRRGTTTDWVPGGTPETGQPRMVTVAAIDAAGAPVSNPIKTAIAADLQARREVTFIVNVMDPNSVIIDVTYQVKALAGYDLVALVASVNAALANYINPATWGVPLDDPVGWNDNTILRYLEVAQVINQVPGVDYITTTAGNLDLQIGLHGSLARADVAMGGIVPLPTTVGGTITGAAV